MEGVKVLCKDCLFFKQWKKIEASICKKTQQPVEADKRLCDSFISKSGMLDEWGTRAAGVGNGCCD